jgi:hypothetical protein
MKVIIAGSRHFNDYKQLKMELDLYPADITEVVCGEAKGADLLGKKWAHSNNVKVSSFPADWGKYGKSAGPKRNMQMGDYADQLIAFWDGESKGTKQMIDYMKRLNKGVYIVYVPSIESCKWD